MLVVYEAMAAPSLNIIKESEINHNISTDDTTYESIQLCKTKKHFINPDNLINSMNDTWTYYDNFYQSIEVELCEDESSPCSTDPEIKSRCKQRFVTIQLQVVSRNNTLSEAKPFDIPSNCECSYLRS